MSSNLQGWKSVYLIVSGTLLGVIWSFGRYELLIWFVYGLNIDCEIWISTFSWSDSVLLIGCVCFNFFCVCISVIRHKSDASGYARATFWRWVFWFGYRERNYGKLGNFPLTFNVILAWQSKLTIMVPTVRKLESFVNHEYVNFDFEGCIVRG